MISALILISFIAAAKIDNRCSISVRVDSIASVRSANDSIANARIYWVASGYSDTCWSQEMICGDAICEKVKRDSMPEPLGVVTPFSSYRITLYGSDDLIVSRGYFASTSFPMWMRSKGVSSVAGGDEFQVIHGTLDSAKVEYIPYEDAAIEGRTEKSKSLSRADFIAAIPLGLTFLAIAILPALFQ